MQSGISKTELIRMSDKSPRDSPGANLLKIYYTMYLGTRKILDPQKYEERRKACMTEKAGTVEVVFSELEGLLNKSQIAAQYFGKSQGWFSQKLNGCMSHNVRQEFTPEEYQQLADAFRHIARRLEAHADEIDNAPLETSDN